MDKLVKLSMDHKKLSRSVNGMKTTLKGLIKEVNAMECKSIGEQLNAIVARINAIENNLHDKGEIIPEAASLIFSSEQTLSHLLSDLNANQYIRLNDMIQEFDNIASRFDFVTKKEMDDALEWSNWTMVAVSIASAILGGCIVALAV